MTDQPTDLQHLAELWREAKRDEDDAKQARIAIEQQIINVTGCKEEGSQTHKAGDWKITVTGKLNHTLDQAAWESIAPNIPEELRPVEYKPTLDTKGLRYLESNNPDVYQSVCEAIVTKPGKPSVEVK